MNTSVDGDSLRLSLKVLCDPLLGSVVNEGIRKLVVIWKARKFRNDTHDLGIG
jgi:hypothetical protein